MKLFQHNKNFCEIYPTYFCLMHHWNSVTRITQIIPQGGGTCRSRNRKVAYPQVYEQIMFYYTLRYTIHFYACMYILSNKNFKDLFYIWLFSVSNSDGSNFNDWDSSLYSDISLSRIEISKPPIYIEYIV